MTPALTAAKRLGLANLVGLANGRIHGTADGVTYVIDAHGRIVTALTVTDTSVPVASNALQEGAEMWRREPHAVIDVVTVRGPSWRTTERRVVGGRDGYAAPEPRPAFRPDPVGRGCDLSQRLVAVAKQNVKQAVRHFKLRSA